MKTVSVIYWSGTGNTKVMAEAIATGAKEANAEVLLLSVEEASVEHVVNADAIALGCPSMGAEVLAEAEMEPFVSLIEGKVKEKPMALFGSYGWGNGEWMEDWVQRMSLAGAKVIDAGLIAQNTPDSSSLEACNGLGRRLAQV